MWNKSVKLVTGTEKKKDEDGFTIETKETCLEGIPANFTDTTRNDELMGKQMGYTANQNIEIAACNYHGESILYDEETGDKYEVKRTHKGDKAWTIVLTCERRERSG